MDNLEREGAYQDCGVKKDGFPCLGKCCSKDAAAPIVSYTKACPYCRISKALPYGASLKTAIIFECGRLGYGRRISS